MVDNSIVNRVQLNGIRYYQITRDNHVIGTVPSVTAILGNTKDKSFLKKWYDKVGGEAAGKKISQDAMLRGTVMHKLLEIYLNLTHLADDDDVRLAKTFELTKIDEEIDVPEIKDYHKKIGADLFYNIHRRYNIFFDTIEEVVLQEKFLWINSGIFAYAGTVDNISKMKDGRIIIIDFKTAKGFKRIEWINDYKLQVAAYAIAYWNLSGVKVDGAEIWISSEKGTAQKFVFTFDELREFFKQFIERLKLFYTMYPSLNN